MIIGRILSPVHSLGPGERICLWTQGCSKKCAGCISPELQSRCGKEINEIRLSRIIQLVAQRNHCTGLTVSGGDPLEQAGSLLEFLKHVRDFFDDILVYTGFNLQEIRRGDAGETGRKCLDYIDVLIDGQYIKELNTSDCVLRGSSNQTIYYFNRHKKLAYMEYMKRGRIIENFVHGDQTIITGILNEVQ